ncbi:MAG: ferric reductase-like transmembrane domain-containing protein [Desulfobulbaceae bacterium]|uniref:Ferric reductase-like transmembrane domain-containing protein n=1 Tax=Candidatus Desulfobia pelagia TaxID=2841692 RepID=A0A8J6NC75_9BACT|nr:ferric reductase-like transmembrane domain-containing protein [Candidatus Desulfobia pelagia]
MNYVQRGFFWVGVYLCLVLTPLFVLLLASSPSGSGFWWDFSIALGFSGTSIMGTMFVLTARFRRAAAPFGIDLIYYYHRWIALVAFVFIIAHPAILVVLEPSLLADLRPSIISWHMLAGAASIMALTAIMVTSFWRQQLRIHYDAWRVGHALLAIAALGLAIGHIEGVGTYVSSPWKRTLWVTISVCCLALLFYVRLIKPLVLLKHPYRVEQVIKERGDAWTLALRPDGHRGFTFLPGQFAWLTLGNSPFALKEHPFSISSSAMQPETIHFTIKELGDFTSRIKDVIPGNTAYLDAPFGAFSIDRHPSSDYIFVAGGIGIAPVMSMLRTLADRGDDRSLLLIYAYKTWESLTFREELKKLQEELHLSVVYVLENPPDDWQGESGFITADLLTRNLPDYPERYEYYLCGPLPMTVMVEKTLQNKGIPLHQVHSELFNLA